MTTRLAAAALVEQLAKDGFAVAPGYFAPSLCSALAAEAFALANDPAAINAGVGRGDGHANAPEIRRARIRWIDGTTAPQAHFLAEAESLRRVLNETLFLSLTTFEAQLALTPTGGFYQRHLDSFRGRRNRIVSLVGYLNAGWQPADGGSLRVWPPADPADNSAALPFDIIPASGTLVLMRSEDVAHEVLPNHRPRASIAGWFRVHDGDHPGVPGRH